MARGDVVFRRHAPEGAVVPEKTKRIDTTSKGMAKAFGRDPLTASAGAALWPIKGSTMGSDPRR